MARRKIDLSVKADSVGENGASRVSVNRNPLPILCERIRFYREKSGLEQKAFAKQLSISPNTVSNWECGRARPDINLLPAICKALDITLYDLYGQNAPADILSSQERAFLDVYRSLNTRSQYVLNRTAEALSFAQKAERHPEIRELLFFSRSLAAGAADPNEFEQDAEPYYLYVSPEVNRADFVFSVNGDSMEPTYHTGDMVLVEKLRNGSELHYGETGAFIVGNETYIKRYEKDGLHSLNKKYEVLRFGEDQPVFLIGRVVGIVSQKDIPSKEDIDAYLSLRSFARI